MKEAIRARARELGFEACGFAPAAPPATGAAFARWLDQGRQGAMSYLERNAAKRLDPQRVLAGAQSLIVLAASYHLPGSGGPDHPGGGTAERERAGPAARPVGLVARYARFADYHDVLGERLQRLAGFVDHLGRPPTRSLGYVDTGPFLERDLAQRAGLGFIGKHTNLISRELGNWLFLAEIITAVPLPPDEPQRNRCGACVRCLAACPTRAILAPFELDARRCISYLTIELKGSIPLEWRPAIGRRIFGCDDCLEVCPWNRFARSGRLMGENARPDLANSDLLELLALDESGFRHRFAGTPIQRVKRSGLRRNVCVALGNAGDARALPALAALAAGGDPLVGEHAQWALEQIAGARTGGSRPPSPAAP